jgi:hypothetical protein
MVDQIIFDEDKELVAYLKESLETGGISPLQFNLISTLLASYNNDSYKASRIISNLHYAINQKRTSVINANSYAKRKEWLSELAIGTRVNIPVNKRRYGRSFREGEIIKIYNGKRGTVYTIKTDSPFYGNQYRSKARSIFRVMSDDLRMV